MSLDDISWVVRVNENAEMVVLVLKRPKAPDLTLQIPFPHWDSICAEAIAGRQKMPVKSRAAPVTVVELAELVARFPAGVETAEPTV